MQKFTTMKSSLSASEYEAAEALKTIKRTGIFNDMIYYAVKHGDPDKARQAFQMIREQVESGRSIEVAKLIGGNAVNKVMSLYK